MQAKQQPGSEHVTRGDSRDSLAVLVHHRFVAVSLYEPFLGKDVHPLCWLIMVGTRHQGVSLMRLFQHAPLHS